MSDTVLMYSTVTGQETHAVDDIAVEHHRPQNLRVTDPRYGLKTAAKTEAERKKRLAERDEFLAARKAALVTQRDGVQTRLDGLQKEIRKTIALLDTGKIRGEKQIEDAFGKLTRMGRTEARLHADITRLNNKIGV